MGHHGVNESRERDGVTKVCRHLAPGGGTGQKFLRMLFLQIQRITRNIISPLCEGASHDRRRARRERELEEPEHQVVDAHQEEVRRAYECLVGVAEVHAPVRERVPDAPEPEGGAARVEEVLEHAVLDVLELDAPRAQHGESRLKKTQGEGQEYLSMMFPANSAKQQQHLTCMKKTRDDAYRRKKASVAAALELPMHLSMASYCSDSVAAGSE